MSEQFEQIIEHSVYCGRERLGRYVQTGRELFEAFDSEDRALGIFKTREAAWAAIGVAAGQQKPPAIEQGLIEADIGEVGR